MARRAKKKRQSGLPFNKKLVVVPTVLFGVLGLAGEGYYVVTHRSADLAQARVLHGQTEVLDGEYAAGVSVKRNFGAWSGKLSALTQELPPRRNQSSLLSDITNGAQTAGVSLKQGSEQSAPPAAAGVSTYSMSIGVLGTPAQVQAFDQALTSMPRLATIQSESLVWSKGTVTGQYTVDTYSAVLR